MEELYFKFVEELSNLGKLAHAELSCSDFIEDDKKLVKQSIDDWQEKLNQVQQSLNKVKELI